MNKKQMPTPEEVLAGARTQDLQTPDNQEIVEEKLGDFTPKQRKFAILCITHPHLSNEQRYEIAGYSPSNIPACLRRIEGKIGELLLAIGITGRDFAEGVRDQLKATKIVFRKTPIYGKKGKILGYEDRKHEVPDNTARAKALAMLERTGGYDPVKVGHIDHTHKHTLEESSLNRLRERERFMSGEIEGKVEVLDDQRAAS